MGKITKLTKAQEAEIPDYIEKWVRQAAKPTNRDETTKAIKDIYKRMGEDEPLVIYGRSPDETVNLAVLYFLTLGSEKNQLRAQLDAQLDAQLSAQLRTQLRAQLDAQLDDQLDAQLDAQLRAQLYAQLRAQLDAQLRDQLDAQLDAQLRGQLSGQLSGQLDAKLNAQLDAQLRGQLNAQLSTQLDDQLNAQLSAQLNAQLSAQLDDQLRDQLRAQLSTQLRAQLSTQLRAQLSTQLDDQLYAQLRTQLSTQLDDQLDAQLDAQLRAQLYAQLNAQLHDANDNTTRRILDSIKSAFYVHDWWLVWCGWYNYAQHIGVKFDKDIYDLFTTYNKNTGLTIPYKGVVFISERPTDIKWENQVLHSDNGSTIKWADGQELYFLRGCSFTKEQWELIMSQKLTMPEIAKMGSDGKLNADQTAVAIQYLGVDNLLEGMNAELISTGKKYDHWQKSSELAKMIGQPGYTWIENEPTKLYKVENFMDTGDTEYCIVMEHPSIKGKKYLEWVEPEIGIKADADLAQAVAFGMTKEDYINADEA